MKSYQPCLDVPPLASAAAALLPEEPQSLCYARPDELDANPSLAGALRVEEINRIADLQPFRQAWQTLWRQTRAANFFQSLDWLEIYWEHFGQGQRLRVLVVLADDQPIGIMPLTVLPEKTRAGTLRVLTYPLHDWGSFYGPVGPQTTATLLAALGHVRDTRRDWDLLDLRWVDWHGCDAGRTEQALRQVGFGAHRQAWAQTALVDLSATWDEYWRSRTKKWRHNVSRLERRVRETHGLEHVRYRPQGADQGDGEPRWDLFDRCLDLSQRSWQGSSTTGTTLCHDVVRGFLRDVHAAAARCGCLDVNLLLLDGRPAAFSYNYRCRDRIFALRMGYDPEFEALGAGTVLQRMILEDSFRRGDRLYDFGPCYLDPKRPWLTQLGTSYRWTHFASGSCRAQLLRLKRWLAERLYGTERAVCARFNSGQ